MTAVINQSYASVPFRKAFGALDNGFVIRRRSWPEGQYLTLDGFKRIVVVRKGSDSSAPWRGPSNDEMSARDWETYTYESLGEWGVENEDKTKFA